MTHVSMELVWISVDNIEKAIEFYTKTVGLKLVEKSADYGWAELEGKSGARIGLSSDSGSGEDTVKPGQNGVMTFTVKSLEESIDSMQKNGATMLGKIQEIPGHVRLQMASDPSGNRFQLVEVAKKHSCCHC